MFINRELTRTDPEFATTAALRFYPVLPRRTNEVPEWSKILLIPALRRRYERMRSEPNTKDKQSWKSCQHYTCWSDPWLPVPLPYYGLCFDDIGHYYGSTDQRVLLCGTAFSSKFGSWCTPNVSPPLVVEQVDGGFLADPPNLSTLVHMALEATLPGIKAELSLVNSLIELKDFKSLPETISSITSLLKRFVGSKSTSPLLGGILSRIRHTFDRSDGPTLREMTRGTADGYLQLEFNILPTISDISGIAAALSRTERRVNDLIVRQGKLQSKHFTRYLDTPAYPDSVGSYTLNIGQFSGTTPVPGYSSMYNAPDHTWKVVRSIQELPPTFHAEIEYNYHFTRFQTEHAQLLGMLDALGVNLNPAIIWNAIPWSFVVDWVVGVSRWLDDRKVLNMEPAVNIMRFLWSYKRVRTIKYDILSSSNPSPRPRTYTRLPDTHETAYKRQVGLPSGDSLITSGLSARELSLGLALAITRRRSENVRLKR